MSDFAKIFTVILSSPGDLKRERKIVKESVEEINLTLNKYYSVNVELRKWETHTRPATGKYAQDIINNQMGSDFDIYLGIMGTTFGTPTPKAESGTEEEFNYAYHLKEKGQNIEILFYFSQVKKQPSKISPEQHQKVNNFRKKIRSLGVYDFEYLNYIEFGLLSRLHLSHTIYDLLIGKGVAAGELTEYLYNIQKTILNLYDEAISIKNKMSETEQQLLSSINEFNSFGEEFTRILTKYQSGFDNIIHTQQKNIELIKWKLNSLSKNIDVFVDKSNDSLRKQNELFVKWISYYSEMMLLVPRIPLDIKLDIIRNNLISIESLRGGITGIKIKIEESKNRIQFLCESNSLPIMNKPLFRMNDFFQNLSKSFDFYLVLSNNLECKLKEIMGSVNKEV